MIEILTYRAINRSSLLGSADICVAKWGDFLIKDVTIFVKPDGRRWINFPSVVYVKDGVDKRKEYNGFKSRENKDLFDKEFFEAFDAYLAQQAKPIAAKVDVPTWGQGRDDGCPF